MLFLFALAVISLALLTNGLVFAFVNFQDTSQFGVEGVFYSWEVFWSVNIAVVILIAIASLIRLATLRRGGASIAELMDGELLVGPGGDLNKRKLLNVVEEMAIASGTPVPPVYIIPENAINAFAAGYSPGDAVIGVTQGAVDNLNRNELQGVIAHEFSHILNGDMRLNIRLMGVLYGILMLALIGRMIVSPSHHAAASRDRTHAGIVAIGAGLMIVGYLGQFFGNLIKAAVSRQREFLADASAVQFTRNPEGIADALKRIGGHKAGSVLEHPESAEISHLFFSEGITFSFSTLMATHPPLDERITRIQPGWDGRYLAAISPEPSGEPGSAPEGAMGFAAAASGISIDPDKVIETIGNPEPSQVKLAQQIIAAIPGVFSEAAHDLYTARALVYLFLLSSDAEVRTNQLKHLQEAADLGVYDALTKLILSEPSLEAGMKLPLLEMAYPTLRQLSYEQYKLFMGNMDVLIRADGRIGLSEWAVQKMMRKHLEEVFESKHSGTEFNKLEQVQDQCEVLLSLLAQCDRQSGVSAESAFDAGREALELPIELRGKKELGFKSMNQAIDDLAGLHPLRKPKLIKACIATVSADNVISTIELELLRTVADCLECPMPPMGNVA
ncbi:MAG: M48 family metallopeptidase [Pseudomonadales bacterium]|nr:M48 family metallopeptidase [Pseudomonadales bacterium]